MKNPGFLVVRVGGHMQLGIGTLLLLAWTGAGRRGVRTPAGGTFRDCSRAGVVVVARCYTLGAHRLLGGAAAGHVSVFLALEAPCLARDVRPAEYRGPPQHNRCRQGRQGEGEDGGVGGHILRCRCAHIG